MSQVSHLFLLRYLRTTCRGDYVWRGLVVSAMVLVKDGRSIMLEIFMMGSMVTGFMAALVIALTLLWIVLTERKEHSSGH